MGGAGCPSWESDCPIPAETGEHISARIHVTNSQAHRPRRVEEAIAGIVQTLLLWRVKPA